MILVEWASNKRKKKEKEKGTKKGLGPLLLFTHVSKGGFSTAIPILTTRRGGERGRPTAHHHADEQQAIAWLEWELQGRTQISKGEQRREIERLRERGTCTSGA